MKRAYYEGIALDYKAQNYDDEYSIREYCRKYCSEFTSNCCTDTTIIEGEEVKDDESKSFWSEKRSFSTTKLDGSSATGELWSCLNDLLPVCQSP